MDDDYQENAAAAVREAAARVRINRSALRTNYLVTLVGVAAVIVDLAVEHKVTIVTLAGVCLTAVGVGGIVVLKRQQTRVDDRMANPVIYLIFAVVALVPFVMGIISLVARQWVGVGISVVLLAIVLGAWYSVTQLNRHTRPTDHR